jgi:hypothetical protein
MASSNKCNSCGRHQTPLGPSVSHEVLPRSLAPLAGDASAFGATTGRPAWFATPLGRFPSGPAELGSWCCRAGCSTLLRLLRTALPAPRPRLRSVPLCTPLPVSLFSCAEPLIRCHSCRFDFGQCCRDLANQTVGL